jgi:hypothetical protein
MSEEFNIFRDGVVHVMREKCSTCIFRPHERPVSGARVAEMVRDTLNEDGSTIVCHHTLSGMQPGPQANAICRGWYDHMAEQDTILTMAKAMGIIDEQDEIFDDGAATVTTETSK